MFHNVLVGGMNKPETEINVKRKKIQKSRYFEKESEAVTRKVKQLSVCEEDKMMIQARRKDSSNMK